MKNTFRLGATLLCSALVFAAAGAEEVKNYQVTGPVLAVTPTSITVKKGEAEWQLARNANTKIKGDLKVGSKVTIYYTMTATEIEVKADKAKDKAKDKEK